MMEQGLSAPSASPAAKPIVAQQLSGCPPTVATSTAAVAGTGVAGLGFALTRLRDIPRVRAATNAICFKLDLSFILFSFFVCLFSALR
jgi:hypothetical protein